ncbi:DUF4230 domain-containing protein [Mediterraneibacter glycyrrhizinilyticus]|nr:DUF4230 domain-containing protein [Mediterraneibacter glycyrrhizinilyticus]MBM6852608.1 DUF4230 domain-containing protein [Mediterraneibacter glycyrrhizinilyticus]
MRASKEEKERNKTSLLKFYLSQKLIQIVLVIVVIIVIALGITRFFSTESKTTKIGFEDIGELATQAAYCTEVNVTEGSRNLFGITIPFTQSKYIYSYDVTIKAGFDFGEIQWELNGHTIEVRLPQAEVLSTEIDLDSLKVYHEEESIFRQITLTENNEALQTLQENAEQNAVENGLLDNARSNAETILTGFFGNVYDMDEYEIVFKDK